nr:hypothetical protein CFP56_21764 [Quercus suber]
MSGGKEGRMHYSMLALIGNVLYCKSIRNSVTTARISQGRQWYARTRCNIVLVMPVLSLLSFLHIARPLREDVLQNLVQGYQPASGVLSLLREKREVLGPPLL